MTCLGDLRRGARGDDAATRVASTWAEVDHPIGACHQSHVVFGDDHGVARVDEAVQLTIQQIHVGGGANS